jgi:uncharacterized membrane protein YfcA
MFFATAGVGLVVGIVVGLTSTGGGALLTPALMLLGIPPSVAIGSDVLAASGMKLLGGGIYALRRQVHWQTVRRLALGSVPGAVAGVLLLNQLSVASLDGALRRALGFALLLAAGATLVRLKLVRRTAPQAMPSRAVTMLLGFVTGFLVSVTSVGSGSLLLCVLTVFFPLEPRTQVGTDLAHALILTAVATVGHWASGRVDAALSLAILAGGVPGVIAGARLALWVPGKALRAGLAAVLLIIGIQLEVTPAHARGHAAEPARLARVTR